MNEKNNIDVVIAWVDGNDPKHRNKLQQFLKTEDRRSDDISGSTRYASEGEIYYCVASVLRFAPFVRKIFIVTDNQNPDLDNFIQRNFSGNTVPVEIVDHKVLFGGYEQYLPTFNSLSIETCLFRIPDLSENFVYFNDDCFLVRPLSYSDWYVQDSVVAIGNWRSIFFDSLLRLIKPRKNGRKPFGFKDSMLNAAQILDTRRSYFHIAHTPHPLKKSVLEQYFTQHEDQLIANISHKFRNETQFNPQELFYLLMFKAQKCIRKPASRLLYMKPTGRRKGYITRKLRQFETSNEILYCCIGSLDLACGKDRTKLLDWLKNILLLN
ncbi:MAG: Stealth CR1 domain-containing protein [Prevotellaceae bacterium]|jgi:hypothetical protein|nr:Stealth CR1 domain-containing protein [Prevotellaceae bacterium]